MKLMVIFQNRYERSLYSFAIMEDSDFIKFQEGWLKYLDNYGEIYMEVYPYESAYFSSKEDFENAFTCYEISEYEASIFKKVFPSLKNCFPHYAPYIDESFDVHEMDDDNFEIEF